ncbi:excalibur calcium-binding domain-containing protein [Consotaella aegiceratis]|uniref:excalibur calcium-binding domain-containing protein n=1 Tax=Consotaella aegiceratis TaxID=3097961 RepID=UPI002F3FED7C
MKRGLALGLLVAAVVEPAGSVGAGASPDAGPTEWNRATLKLAQRQSCKTVSSCREAVILWCGGYRRADGDHDGIPCENVCSSREEVDRIRADIGC